MRFANLRFLSKLLVCFGAVLACVVAASVALHLSLGEIEDAAARNQ